MSEFNVGDEIVVTATREELDAVYADPELAGRAGEIDCMWAGNIRLSVPGITIRNFVQPKHIKKK